MRDSFNATRFGLSLEQQSIWDLAVDFGREQIEPHAIDWDQKKFFPIDVIKIFFIQNIHFKVNLIKQQFKKKYTKRIKKENLFHCAVAIKM